MQQLIAIKNDLFDIANRLKSIKPTYFVCYNTKTQHFEVHDSAQRGGSLAFVVPYEELDARTLQYARMTSIQNAERLLSEIEQNNAKLDEQQAKRSVEQVLTKMENCL